MNCARVRDLLPEHALGVAAGDAAAIDRHLAGCAACRKEARELHGAAASLAYALAPASPPPALEDDVVAAVHATGRPPRRPRAVAGRTAVMLAAALDAGRAGRGHRARAARAGRGRCGRADRLAQERAAIEDFLESSLTGEGTVASIGVLRPAAGGPGAARPSPWSRHARIDSVLVVASGLAGDGPAVPGRARRRWQGGSRVRDGADPRRGRRVLGRKPTGRDLSSFVNVLVRDRDGEVVLRGTLRDEVPAPAPRPPAG